MNQPLEKSLSLDNVDISASLIIDESDVENFNQKTTTDVANNDYPHLHIHVNELEIKRRRDIDGVNNHPFRTSASIFAEITANPNGDNTHQGSLLFGNVYEFPTVTDCVMAILRVQDNPNHAWLRQNFGGGLVPAVQFMYSESMKNGLVRTTHVSSSYFGIN